MRFTINVAPVTKKNSQRIIKARGHYMVIPSKAYLKYEKASASYMPETEPIEKPVNLKAVFYMPTRRRVDLVNLEEALCDLLVHYKVIADDNCKIVFSMDGSRVDYDKENPRTEVEIKEIE